ncbi:MAG: hypothetical protein WEB03_02065 [Nitriliruptor sp.]|uniref:hypothetical protein n=1 Tax=Nitriliruptor sp. TaxID=2448056 RepID=UPI0034A06432
MAQQAGAPTHRLRTVSAATILGALGVASLPLFLAYPGELPVYVLALAAPIAVALAGEAMGLTWLRAAGLITAAAGVAAPVVGLGLFLVVLAVLGPLAVVLAVGPAIRAIDATAGTAFLSACAIVMVGGFAGAAFSPPIVVGVTVLVLVGGTATTLARLGDHRDGTVDVDEV